ncbi:MAG: DUF58 domain-containing protein [Gammaproteobacteria bacterium]
MNPSSPASSLLSLKERFHIHRFTRGEKASAEAVTLSHRRIFILPNKVGLFCGAALGVMLLAAIVYNNNPGFILTFLLGGVCLVSILHNFRSLSGLRVSVETSPPVFAGETALCRIRIENPSPSQRLNLEVSLRGQAPVMDSVSAQSSTIFPLPLKSARRGWLNPGTVIVSSRYPLGLFRAWSPLNFSHSILVYPKPAEKSVELKSFGESPGQRPSRSREGEDFSGLQEYRAGDSPRRIHWKAYAKGRGLLVKEFDGNAIGELWFDLDRIPGGSLEDRISQLCRLILDAERAGFRYGLRLPGYRQEPGCGAAHRNSCLKALALH